MELFQLFGIGAALIGGWLGKKAGGSVRVGGKLPAQKILAPVAAVLVGAGYGQVTGEMTPETVANTSGAAILIHTLAKNFLQFGGAAMRKEE